VLLLLLLLPLPPVLRVEVLAHSRPCRRT
jgi:hypothetical protein